METEHFVFITQPSLTPRDSMKGCIAHQRPKAHWCGRMLSSVLLLASSQQCYRLLHEQIIMPNCFLHLKVEDIDHS